MNTVSTLAADCSLESFSRRGAAVALRQAYSVRVRVLYTLAAATGAVLLAGFWNFRLVDDFGRELVTGNVIGDSAVLSDTFAVNGMGFGVIFAVVAGLAATFTACNCVVFAMLPRLATTGDPRSRGPALAALGVFTAGVLAVGAAYGMFIGFLGADGIEAFNAEPVRIAQANTVFSLLGVLMLTWGAFDLGFLEPVRRRVSPVALAFFEEPATKAGLLGLMVGAFAIGRPFPVMRDFLAYAAAAGSPLYSAGVMMVQGLGQIAVVVGLFLILVLGFGRSLTRWTTARPEQLALVGAMALVAGGAFFLFYWGLAFAFDVGQWGFKLGWYS